MTSQDQIAAAQRDIEAAERALAEARRRMEEAQRPADPCALAYGCIKTKLSDPQNSHSHLIVDDFGRGQIHLTYGEAAHLIPVLRRYIARGGVSEKGEEVLP